MAKSIKFNLILDDYPVRNLEGLQQHFSIEDMLKYFENGLLLRWLDVREYKKQYDAVNSIEKSQSKIGIITEMVKIFEIEMEDNLIEKAVSILKYLDEEKELNTIYKKNGFTRKQIIDDYHSGYAALVLHMQENRDCLAILKADAIEMERQYFDLFVLDHYGLYFKLVESAPKAVFALLTRDVFRKYWIGEQANSKIYSNIKLKLLTNTVAKEILGEDLKIIKRNTQAMWDPIERPEVKLMVISIASGTFVKNAGEFSEKMASTDVNEKLVKFNGLEYQCNKETYELLYMEV